MPPTSTRSPSSQFQDSTAKLQALQSGGVDLA